MDVDGYMPKIRTRTSITGPTNTPKLGPYSDGHILGLGGFGVCEKRAWRMAAATKVMKSAPAIGMTAWWHDPWSRPLLPGMVPNPDCGTRQSDEEASPPPAA